MSQRPVAVLGECVADALTDPEHARVGELALRVLPGGGPANTAVALGADGALASLDGARVGVPAVPVEVADTVGAGDAFTAGLLHHLGRQGHLGGRLTGLTPADVAEACAFAARVAALTCAATGPNPPWAEQLERAGTQ